MSSTAADRRRAPLTRLVEAAAARWAAPGLAITIVDRHGRTITACAGQNAADRPIDAHTLFGIASCTKPFAVATLGMLVAEGRLDWDTRVKHILPWLRFSDPYVTKNATVRDLLCNRLGLVSSEHRHRRCAMDRADLLRRLADQPFRHAFRAEFGYCTDGFTIAGEVVTALTGMPWADVAASRIWAPLGMTRTNADHRSARGDDNSACPHIGGPSAWQPVEWDYEDDVAVPAGGMNSCLADLSRWLTCQLAQGYVDGQAVLPAACIDEPRTPHTADRGRFRDAELSQLQPSGIRVIAHESYGLGWYIDAFRGRTLVYHTGGIVGFRAVAGFLPDAGIGVAVLTNCDDSHLARGVFLGALDIAAGNQGADWIEAAWAAGLANREQEATARAALLANWAAQVGSVGLADGRYQGDRGFGWAELQTVAEGPVLRIGAAHFSLEPLHQGSYIAHPRRGHPIRDAFLLRAVPHNRPRFETSHGGTFTYRLA